MSFICGKESVLWPQHTYECEWEQQWMGLGPGPRPEAARRRRRRRETGRGRVDGTTEQRACGERMEQIAKIGTERAKRIGVGTDWGGIGNGRMEESESAEISYLSARTKRDGRNWGENNRKKEGDEQPKRKEKRDKTDRQAEETNKIAGRQTDRGDVAKRDGWGGEERSTRHKNAQKRANTKLQL
jgi:hypothetical protein